MIHPQCCRKYCMFLIAAVSVVISLAFIANFNHTHYLLKVLKIHEPSDCFMKGPLADGTITALIGSKTLVIAPYYDNRDKNDIRVIVIAHHLEKKDLYCWFHCRSNNGYLSKIKAHIDIHSDRAGFPYGTADLLCPEPKDCDPKFVSIHWSTEGDCDQIPMFEIRNRHPEAFSIDFTICISTMFGNYNNVLQFIQSVEIYKLFGVQKVLIYKSDCSPLMERVLEHYISEGTVEIIPWPITSHLKVSKRWHYDMSPADIGCYGQITALNDCVYRNMYRSKYVLLHDIDKIILPMQHLDLNAMMADIEKWDPHIGVFLFENFVFRFDVFDSTFNISSWNSVPGGNILQHIRREPPKEFFQFKTRKMIVNPRKVIQATVHHLLKFSGSTLSVPNNTAILYHCRKYFQANLTKDSLVEDKRIWKCSLSIIQRVSNVLKEIMGLTEHDT